MNLHPNKKYYGAQYRDMHTAVHKLVIFEKASDAEKLVRHLARNGTLPDFYSVDPVDSIRIHFRRPPTEFKDQKLTIVNDRVIRSGLTVPDVY